MEYYSAIKKKEILPFATTWMGLQSIMLSEINQTKIKYHYDLICGILTTTIEERARLLLARAWRWGGGRQTKWLQGVKIYKFSIIK